MALVQIGKKVFDSDQQPISIKFFQNERPVLLTAVAQNHDIVNFFPKNMDSEELNKFNVHLKTHPKVMATKVESPEPEPISDDISFQRPISDGKGEQAFPFVAQEGGKLKERQSKPIRFPGNRN